MSMKKSLLQKSATAFLSMAAFALFALPASVGALIPASNVTNDKGLDTAGNFSQNIGLGKADIKGSVASIINIVLGILGIVAVVIILAGGFKWMTAGGNEDKVGEARKLIVQGAIGLVIIFAAWGIASFVISQLSTATSV